jgi:hypothetical protein
MSPALTYCPHGHPAVECLRCVGEFSSPTLLDVERMWDAPVVPEPKRPRVSPYAAPILLIGGITAVGYIALGAGCILLGRLAWHAAQAIAGR